MFKNRASQKWTIFAFSRVTNEPLLGDAANITAKIRSDDGTAIATNDTNPTEVEDGYYDFELTMAETNGDKLQLLPESSTTDIQVFALPAVIYTEEYVAEVSEPQEITLATLLLTSYSTRAEADTYFEQQLHSGLWAASTPNDRVIALQQASQIIDALDFVGMKNAAYLVWAEYTEPLTDDEQDLVDTAAATQVLEFPRGSDTSIPQDIQIACFKIAYALLDGRDPDDDLENLQVSSQGFSSVRTTFTRAYISAHLVNGVPSATAWRYLERYLKRRDGVRVRRVS